MTGNPSQPRWKVAAISLALVVLVFAVFGQTAEFGFINRDDPDYVYNNPIILKGLSLPNIEWAFTHVVSGHWHPLTVMLFMAEAGFFGKSPGGYHLVNVLLHAVVVVLLFLLLLEMTGALWRSGFVAAVFAIHPLRAESVAWIAECKDVLSGVFFMLTLWAYARYARGPRRKVSYAMMLLWFALGLMSKPMLVTTPGVLLLLDYWPLGRLKSPREFGPLLWEKLPLFGLCALSSIATVVALKAGSAPTSSYPADAPIAYVAYLGKLIYPANLAALYPLPQDGPPPWEVLDAILVLAALTAGAWFLRRSYPYLAMGWLWYLGMLVPVAGVMQTGNQAYADRYTYLPQVGLCIAVTWAAADWLRRWRHGRAILGTAAAAILCALLAACWHQTGYWRNSETLWTHALDCTKDNLLAYNGLAEELLRQGRTDEAISLYRQTDSPVAVDAFGNRLLLQGLTDQAILLYRAALQIDPNYAEAHIDLGIALYQKGRIDEAIAEYRQALRLNPASAEAHGNLGDALSREGRINEAIAEYRAALAINPDYAEVHTNLGAALFREGSIDESIAEYRQALQLDSRSAQAHNDLGIALYQKGRLNEAIAEYRRSLQLNPEFAEAHNDLGNALSRKGHLNEAIPEYRAAFEINPAYAAAHSNLGAALFQEGAIDASISEYRQAVQLDPRDARTHNDLGNALLRGGHVDEAISEYRAALQINPNYTEAQNNLGSALAQRQHGQAGQPAKDGRW